MRLYTCVPRLHFDNYLYEFHAFFLQVHFIFRPRLMYVHCTVVPSSSLAYTHTRLQSNLDQIQCKLELCVSHFDTRKSLKYATKFGEHDQLRGNVKWMKQSWIRVRLFFSLPISIDVCVWVIFMRIFGAIIK